MFSTRLRSSRSSLDTSTTIAGISLCPRARKASIRPCPHTKSYPGSVPSSADRRLTWIGFFRPRFLMLCIICSNFFLSRGLGFRTRIRSMGIIIISLFMQPPGVLRASPCRKSNPAFQTGTHPDRRRSPRQGASFPKSCQCLAINRNRGCPRLWHPSAPQS